MPLPIGTNLDIVDDVMLTSPHRLASALVATLLATTLCRPAGAEVPRVATDVPPVHSLVARVMDGIGEPRSVMRPGASPHGYAMRPSEALVLERSDAVFWIGEALTPWLGRQIDTLAPAAVSVALMALPGTHRLERRDGVDLGAHGRAGTDDGAREDADGHGDGHGGGEGDGHENHHDAPYDPHGWLDPLNARLWLGAIADTLASLDPDNAARYAANAAAGQAEIDALVTRTAERLEPLREYPFILYHDSIRYFEARFGIAVAATLSPDDASDPGPARWRAVRDTIVRHGVGCAFAEPELDPARLRALVDGLDITLGTLDPLGVTLTPGPALYGELIDTMGDALLGCSRG